MTTSLRRALEWYLSIPAGEEGARTTWRLEWPGGPLSSPALLLPIGVLALAYVFILYRRDAPTVSARRRLLLTSLRVVSILLAVACLHGVALSVGRVGMPTLAIMIDDSASMGLSDHSTASPSEPSSTATRLDLVKSLLTGNDGRFLADLTRNYALRLYRFSDTATPIGSAGDASTALPAIRALRAEGARTRPGPSLLKVLDDYRGTPLAAILILSDFRASAPDESDQLTAVAPAAAAGYTPLYNIGVGSDQPELDLELLDLVADDLAFVGDRYTASGKIKSEGFADRSATVRIVDAKTGAALAEATAPVSAGQAAPFSLGFTPTAAGELGLSIEVLPFSEESNNANNHEERVVRVRDGKIRVLYVEGYPRWEFRYVKALLERDLTIELKTVLQEADPEYAAEDQTALPLMPQNREDLWRFDVILLGDVNPVLMGAHTLEAIRDFVRDAGGGAMLIAGVEFNPRRFQGTPLADLVPWNLAEWATAGDFGTAKQFSAAPTADGLRGAGIARFGLRESEAVERWRKLPPLQWRLDVGKLRPAARVLVRAADQNSLEGSPLLIAQPVGAGRVLYQATDETWRWRFREGDLFFGPYWTRCVRYLTRTRDVDATRLVEISSDRATYSPEDRPRIRVRFIDQKSAPAANEEVLVTIEELATGAGGGSRTVALKPAAGDPNAYEADIPSPAVGAYRARISRPAFREKSPTADFRVVARSEELLRRHLDRYQMEQSAAISKGGFARIVDAEEILAQIPPGLPIPLGSRERIPLWNRPEVLAAFAALLIAEWILRKRARLV